VTDLARDRLRVTGMYAGPASRLAAFALDSVIIATLFTLVVAAAAYVIGLITSAEAAPGHARGIWWTAGLVGWAFTYTFTSLVIAGRTPGKAIVGLRIVAREGGPLRPRAAFVRVITLPVTGLTLGIGFIGILLGRERRALHDILAGTAVVYDWGDRSAELPTPLSRYLERTHALADALPAGTGPPGHDAPPGGG